MAEIVLSEAEKQSPTYLAWSDEAIGKAARVLALKIGDEYGQEAIYTTIFAAGLAGQASRSNCEELTLEVFGLTEKDRCLGDWKITIERLDG